MKPPAAIWEVEYRVDRRGHHHRCRCCRRVLKDGEKALMTRMGSHKTVVIHLACGAVQHGTAAWTWRDAMTYWGSEFLIESGWKLALPACPSNEGQVA